MSNGISSHQSDAKMILFMAIACTFNNTNITICIMRTFVLCAKFFLKIINGAPFDGELLQRLKKNQKTKTTKHASHQKISPRPCVKNKMFFIPLLPTTAIICEVAALPRKDDDTNNKASKLAVHQPWIPKGLFGLSTIFLCLCLEPLNSKFKIDLLEKAITKLKKKETHLKMSSGSQGWEVRLLTTLFWLLTQQTTLFGSVSWNFTFSLRKSFV